jgi:hypothetical protein
VSFPDFSKESNKIKIAILGTKFSIYSEIKESSNNIKWNDIVRFFDGFPFKSKLIHRYGSARKFIFQDLSNQLFLHEPHGKLGHTIPIGAFKTILEFIEENFQILI